MMRYYFIAALLFITFNLCAQEMNNGDLHVVVENIKHPGGLMQLAIYSTHDSFLKEPLAVKSYRIDSTGSATITFPSLPYGNYGISIFHDLNENVELDTNLIGIPKEPFGFSNNAMGTFGPPSFDKASVPVSTGEQTTHIRLKSF